MLADAMLSNRSICRIIRHTMVKRAIAYKLQGEKQIQGMDIAIENRKGSVRSGTDKDGKAWKTKMKHPYGYIRKSEGADGDHVDCFTGPLKDAAEVYIVHIKHPDTGKYDEDKCFIGFASKAKALAAFRQNYTNPNKYIMSTTTMTTEAFKERLERDFKKNKPTKLNKKAGTFNVYSLDKLARRLRKLKGKTLTGTRSIGEVEPFALDRSAH